jgi:hypothetical protein
MGSLSASHKQLVVVLDMVRLEAFVRHWHGLPGRPLAERAALGRAFIAKAVLNLPTTRGLIERVQADKRPCVVCAVGRGPSRIDLLPCFCRIRRERTPLAAA